MRAYRYYVLNGRDRIAASETVVCADDAAARRRAMDLLRRAAPAGAGFEVWDGVRRVHRLPPEPIRA